MHHRDAVGQRQRLDLVVGDVDHGRAELHVQLLDLDPELGAELGVEVGERLVEQEDIDVAHQRPADRDALALAAGQFRRPALEERLDLQESTAAFSTRRAISSLGTPRDAEPEGQVPLRRHPRIERVGLEHHADAAVLGLLPGDVLAVDPDLAGIDVEEPGDGVEQRRLAAARGAEEHDELAGIHLEIEILQHLQVAEGDPEVLDRYLRHGPILSPRRRRCRGRTSGPTRNRRSAARRP